MRWLLVLFLAPYPLSASAAQPVDRSSDSVRVVIDPRIELMGVVQLLSDYMLTTQYEFTYKHDVRVYFTRYQDHPAVTMFREMSQAEFNFDAVPKAMLALSNPPELESRTPFSDYAIRRAGGEDRLNEFVDALRDFARQSRFETFFAAHQGTFEQVVDGTRSAVENAVDVLRAYSGMEIAGSTVVVGMLLHHGGFSATVEHQTGETDVFAVIGPVGSKEGLPTFGTEANIAGIAWHEFSHTYINPLTEAYADEVAKYAALYEPIAQQMGRQAYPVWDTAVNEHIIRAITARLAYLEDGQAAGDEELDNQKKRGFVYVEALAERLKEYESARDRYPTIAEFYPRLLDVFGEAAEAGGR